MFDHSNNVTDPIIRSLALGPGSLVTSWPQYYVNGYNFHTMEHDKKKSTMNSGVCVKSVGYENGAVDFYGNLEEVIECNFASEVNMRVVLFKCRWVDPMKGTRVHPKYHIVEVNHKMKYRQNEPYILASQAIQVYYVPYPSMKKGDDWIVACKTRARKTVDERWTSNEETYQPEGCEPVPIVTTVETTTLHDAAGITLYVDMDEAMSSTQNVNIFEQEFEERYDGESDEATDSSDDEEDT